MSHDFCQIHGSVYSLKQSCTLQYPYYSSCRQVFLSGCVHVHPLHADRTDGAQLDIFTHQHTVVKLDQLGDRDWLSVSLIGNHFNLL